MFTDPTKLRMGDPGHPDECPVFIYHRMYGEDATQVEEIKMQCEAGTLGCVNCKLQATEKLLAGLGPVMQRRAELAQNLDYVHKVLRDGAEKARAVASETMSEVRAAMHLGSTL